MWPFKKKDNVDAETMPHNWFRLALSLVAFVPGIGLALLGNSITNPIVIVLGIAFMAGSVLVFRSGWHTGGSSASTTDSGQTPNSLNIYADKVKFEYIENCKGMKRKCYNDGKFYYLNIIIDLNSNELVELKLPDDDESERYYPPSEYANVITMPANKKYYSWAASTMQKIGIGVMGIVIGAELIGLIVVGG